MAFPIRILVLILGSFLLTSLLSNILVWNFTNLCMVYREGSNDTEHSEKFHWAPENINTLFSSFSWSATITVMPFTFVVQKYGIKWPLVAISLLSSLATLASPLAAHGGWYILLICRLLQGFGYAILFSVVGSITAFWAPLTENGIFLSLLTSAIQLSPVITMPLSAALCTSPMRWPGAYYVHGIWCLLLTITWGYFYRNQPRHHSWVTSAEVKKIDKGKSNKSSHVVPWKGLLTSAPVWGVVVATFGNMFGMQSLIYYTPTYLTKVLNFSLMTSGLIAGLPYLTQFMVKITCGLLTDKLKCPPEIMKLRIFNSVALMGMAGFLSLLTFVPSSEKLLAVVVLISAAAILGFHVGGFLKCVSLVARQFSPMAMGLVQLATCIVLLIVPYIKGMIVTDDSDVYQWRVLFLLAAGVLTVSNLVFCVVCKAEAASWTKIAAENDLSRVEEVEVTGKL